MSDEKQPGLPAIDLNEYGGKIDGERQTLDRRLFMQLLVFAAPEGSEPAALSKALADACTKADVRACTYDDANDPRGIGLLTWSETPEDFVTKVRPLFGKEPLRALRLRPEMTMLGRTYSSGHEPRLRWWLLEKPVENVTNPALGWAV